nr:endophilin-B2-like [Cherax quadricarinatus]
MAPRPGADMAAAPRDYKKGKIHISSLLQSRRFTSIKYLCFYNFQYTEEKIGSAEKTELDGHFESLSHQADSARHWTEKMLVGAESVLIPNPGNRVEDMIFEKIEKRRPNRLSNLEYFGLDMVQAGNDFGSGTAYGSALLKVGGAEQRLGMVEREFISNAVQGFIQPLRKFLETEMKTITKEKRLLETKRLDLDACKSRLRKARSLDGQSSQKDAVDPKVLVARVTIS